MAYVATAAAILLWWSTPANSEMQGAVPAYSTGDNWTFDRIAENGSRQQFSESLVDVSQEEIVVLLSESGRKRNFSPLMNPLEKDGVEVPRVQFPMAVGRKWEGDWQWVRNGGNRIGSHSMHWKVVAEEDVDLPVGKIKALKVEGNGWVKDRSTISSVGGDIRSTETFWYSPAVKRIVKYQGKNLKWIPPQFIEVYSLSYELRSYELVASPP